jgi:very-short-patch-repair endonuclease
LSENKKSDTSIERELAASLEKFGINYMKQVPAANVSVADLSIKNTNILIYADGIYWHRRPEAIKKDIAQMKILTAAGYIVFRFWEDEIHRDSDGCILKIINYMEL